MPSLHLEKRVVSQWSKGQRGWRGRAGTKGSQEVVSHRLLGGDAPRLLGSGLKDDEIFLEMLIQLQDGCHVPTAEVGQQQLVCVSRSPEVPTPTVTS